MHPLHELYTTALQALPDAIVILDTARTIQFINRAALDLFHLPDSDTVIGKLFTVLPGGTGLMTREQQVAFYKRVNEFAIHKVSLPPSDQQEWSTAINNRSFNFRTIPLHTSTGQPTGLLVCIDELTRERTASNLLSNLIFEMVMPLQSIRGFAEVMLLDTAKLSSDQQREWLAMIRDKSKWLLELRETIMAEQRELNRTDQDNG